MSITSKNGLLGLCGSLLGLSTIAVSLRFYCRKQQKARLMADDWTALISVLTYVGTCTTVFACVHLKFLGYSSPPSAATNSKTVGQLEAAFDVINTSTLGWTKLSAVFLIRRIFYTGVGKEWINTATIATAVVVVICYTVWSFIALFQCGTHFSAFWNGEFVKYCNLNIAWSVGFAISDLVLDLWVLALPIPRILRLHTTTGKKLSIIGVFLLAFVGLGASIARIVIFTEYEHEGEAYERTHNLEREQTKLAYIQMLESGISVTAVNLPSLWLLCTTTIPRKLSSGLQSLHSLLSSGKGASRYGSVSTITPTLHTSETSSVDVDAPKSTFHTMQDPAPVYFLQGNSGVQGNEAYAMRHLGGEGDEGFTGPVSGVQVRRDVEVTRV